MPRPASSASDHTPFVSIIIPARNEELNIKRCVSSFLGQSYPADRYEIIVVDDNSTDNTASIVQRMMTDHPQLKLISAEALPEGWTGKNHACWTGAGQAGGEWYCFVDADVASDPRLLETAMSFSESNRLGLLSINPFQELVSVSERCLLPGIFFAIAGTMNFKNINDPNSPDAIANGQFMLFRRSAYESVGGHRAVRNVLMEDIELAIIVKRSGVPFCWVFGENLIRTRMYRSFVTIWEGFSKNIADVMNITGAGASIHNCLKSLLLAWLPLLLPMWALFFVIQNQNSSFLYWGIGMALAGSAIMFASALSTIRFLNLPLFYVLCFPLGLTMHTAITIQSLRQRKIGKRKWKGRTYSED